MVWQPQQHSHFMRPPNANHNLPDAPPASSSDAMQRAADTLLGELSRLLARIASRLPLATEVARGSGGSGHADSDDEAGLVSADRSGQRPRQMRASTRRRRGGGARSI